MPLYDLLCLQCDEEWEAFSVVSGKDEIECPSGNCSVYGVTQITCRSKAHYYEEYDPQLSTRITGPAQREKVLRSKNLVEITRHDHGTTHQATKDARKEKKENDDLMNYYDHLQY